MDAEHLERRGSAVTLPKAWWHGAIAVTALALAGYLAISIAVDGWRTLDAISRMGLGALWFVLALSLLNYTLRFLRWHLYLTWQGQRVPVWRNAAIYLSGFALTVSPGKAGEAVRSFYLRRENVPYATSLATLFVERLVDLLAIVVLASLLLGVRAGLEWTVGMASMLLALAISLVSYRRVPVMLRGFSPRLGAKAGRLARWLADILEQSRPLLHPGRLAAVLALSIVAWGAEGYGVQVLLQALGYNFDLLLAVGTYGLAIFSGAAAVFLPAGLGGTEAVMTGLLTAAGASVPDAIAVTLVCRLATLWFAVAIGVGALVGVEFWELSRRKAALP